MEKEKIDKEKKELYKVRGFIIEGILFKVSEDDMYVYVDANPQDRIIQKMLEKDWNNIKEGLEKEGFFGILEVPEFTKDKIIVAKGNPPVPPVPERLKIVEKFLPLIEGRECKEELLDPSKIEDKELEDLKDICKRIICAEEKEIIAYWIPAQEGIPGKNIWGEIIKPPSLPKEKTFFLGKNVILDKEKKIVFAKVSGVVQIEKNPLSIEVYPEYTIDSDVDFRVGNIYFIGKKLTITGDVKYGFKIISDGDLVLQGTTENRVYIEVKGNFISEGIIRGEHTQVIVFGNAKLKGVEHATLKIYGNLEIENTLLFSEVVVSGEFLCTGRIGIVYGGVIKVEGNGKVNILGNEAQTPTEFFVGYNPKIINKYIELTQKEFLIKESLKKLSYVISIGEKLEKEGKLTPKKKQILLKIKEKYKNHMEEFNKIKKTFKTLIDSVSKIRTKSLIVLKKVYPGVRIGIADVVYNIVKEKTGPIKFVVEKNFIAEKEVKEKIN